MKAFALPTASSPFSPMSDERPSSSLDSASDRSVLVSSQDTGSLASGRSKTRALSARVLWRDAADAKRVLRTIQQVKDGTYKVKKGGPRGKYLIHRTLHPSGYKLLREVELGKEENKELLEYVDGDKLRFDYTRRPYKGDKQFVIHMPSAFHEAVAGDFNFTIAKWLGNINNGTLCKVDSSREETIKIARQIKSTLSTRVKCQEPRDDQLEPDLSFTYRGCGAADLVVEVAWSQSNLKLPDRATRYITGKKGSIRTVVGLNMNDIYRGGSRASFSIWKAEQDGDKWRSNPIVINKEFINNDGEIIEDCTLSLSLNDFICAKRTSRLGDFEDVPLEISSNELYNFYKFALTQQVIADTTEGIEKVQKKVNSALEKILNVENILLEQRTEDPGRRTATGKEKSADIRTAMSEVEDEITNTKNIMKDLEDKMGKAGDDGMEEVEVVEEARVEVKHKLAELETKLAQVRAEEARIAEQSDGRSKRSRVRSALGLSSKN
ncbi:hypothetical protein F5Y10DRAFT_284891 [Nemania abortiva]|nr:hypothetical protein F5Y10DRAFT_284891 [Nemania abortiva]